MGVVTKILIGDYLGALQAKEENRQRAAQTGQSEPWLQGMQAQPQEPANQGQAQVNAPEGPGGWDWLKTRGGQMANGVVDGLQQRYYDPYFGKNGVLNFTQNGPWRR